MSLTQPVPILHVHYGDEWIRGSERCLLDLLRGMDRSRFTPQVWCNAHTMADAVRELDIPVQVHPFPILFGWTPPRFDVSGYARLIRTATEFVRGRNIRLLHATSGAPVQGLVPVARTTRRPLIVQLNAVYNIRERHLLGLHNVSLAIGASESAVRGLREDGVPAARIDVIANGIDPARLEAGDLTGLRSTLGISADAPVVLCIASLIERKAVDIAIRAFDHAWKRHPQARLIVAGEGPDRVALEQLAGSLACRQAVQFIGECKTVGALLRDAGDVLISASRLEALPLTLLEAWYFGLPVVATAVAGHTDLVEDGRNGRMVPVDDPVALGDALASVLDDPERARAMGAVGQEQVRSGFLLQHNSERMQAAFDRTLAMDAVPGWFGPWHPPLSTVRWLARVGNERLKRGSARLFARSATGADGATT